MSSLCEREEDRVQRGGGFGQAPNFVQLLQNLLIRQTFRRLRRHLPC